MGAQLIRPNHHIKNSYCEIDAPEPPLKNVAPVPRIGTHKSVPLLHLLKFTLRLRQSRSVLPQQY